jgi:hypothetical protein
MTDLLINLENNTLNSVDSPFMLYLTPELEQTHQIYTVENALQYYIENGLSYGNGSTITDFVTNKNELLKDFDYEIYYRFYRSNILFDGYIDSNVRESIIDDIERLSIIHYYRVGRGDYGTYNKKNVDSNFNPYLYKVAHNISSDMTTKEAYFDYLNRLDSDTENVVIGNINDLAYQINCNVSIGVDNLTVGNTLVVKENIVVYKNSIINGNVLSESGGLEINGGTLMIDNSYGNVSRMFDQSRLSSNALMFENSGIMLLKDDGIGIRNSSSNILSTNTDLRVESNLDVRDCAIFRNVVVIGNNVIPDENYSLLTEKKIRVDGTDVLSDRRLKTYIDSLDTKHCLENIMKVDLKKYVKRESGELEVGVLANDIVDVFPNIVSSNVGMINISDCIAIDDHTLKHVSETDDWFKCVTLSDIVYVKHTEKSKMVGGEIVNMTIDKINLKEAILIPEQRYKVFKEDKNILSVDYNQLFVYLIGAFQELYYNVSG